MLLVCCGVIMVYEIFCVCVHCIHDCLYACLCDFACYYSAICACLACTCAFCCAGAFMFGWKCVCEVDGIRNVCKVMRIK